MQAIDYAWVACLSAFRKEANLAIRAIENVNKPQFNEIIISNYTSHPFTANRERSRIVDCQTDWGPGSKLLCCLKHLNSYDLNKTFITLVDDDVAYKSFLLSEIQKSVSQSSAISFYGYHVGKLRVLQGVDALTTLGSHWSHLQPWVEALFIDYPWLRFHDDLWLSLWLKIKGVKSIVTRPPRGLVYTPLCRGHCKGLVDQKGNLSRARLNSRFRRAMSKRYMGLV